MGVGASTGYIRHLICRDLPQQVSIVKPEFTVVEQKYERIESDDTGTVTIPAGKRRVWIRNVGAVNGGDLAKIMVAHGADDPFPIEVDGQHQFLHEYNTVLCEEYPIQEITITTNGATVWVDTYEKI